MSRRAGYMYGAALPKEPDGQVGAGLGQTTSTGTLSQIPPTLDITETGQQVTVDGVDVVFQLTPGTEAPSGRTSSRGLPLCAWQRTPPTRSTTR
jgi:linear primary-alkylsulfatase